MRSGSVRDLALHFTVTEGMVANLRMMGHMTEISSTENASKDINHGTCANEVIARLANSITGAPTVVFDMSFRCDYLYYLMLDHSSGSLFVLH